MGKGRERIQHRDLHEHPLLFNRKVCSQRIQTTLKPQPPILKNALWALSWRSPQGSSQCLTASGLRRPGSQGTMLIPGTALRKLLAQANGGEGKEASAEKEDFPWTEEGLTGP